ncbi:relaxase/mobilization nuclease domain-containing protein [Ruminococcus flavefaciens]|uniref:relaxase/mobilization nuclease domain-containing protein n=1 Tax=Ruminococcus flavefaciens TaxID=1265 RepID=UPI0026F31D02|nr:relaxase/mobilization nuclease domain-containing protein [Ruminococcus flavefaciens]
MAKIDVIRNTYGGLEYLNNALGYVSDDRALYRGGYGVNPYDYSMAYNQMLYTRQYFNKVSGNPLVHIIIAYNDQVKDLATAARYGQQCAQYFSPYYQILYCTHEKDNTCGSFHTHIIINAVSYINGQMIQTGYEEMNTFCNYVSQVTGQSCRFYFDNKAPQR